jgi:hypothetical protein
MFNILCHVRLIQHHFHEFVNYFGTSMVMTLDGNFNQKHWFDFNVIMSRSEYFQFIPIFQTVEIFSSNRHKIYLIQRRKEFVHC